MAKAKDALKKYIETFYNNDYKDVNGKNINTDFLIYFSICIEDKKTERQLIPLSECSNLVKYYDDYKTTSKIKTQLQDIKDRFRGVCKRGNIEFNTSNFADFIIWWCNQPQAANGDHFCSYCGMPESLIGPAMDNPRFSKSSKPSFSEKLQVDQKKPKGGYNSENCVFACALCNNAKSDMISADDFTDYIAPAIREYWYSLLNKETD